MINSQNNGLWKTWGVTMISLSRKVMLVFFAKRGRVGANRVRGKEKLRLEDKSG